MQDPFTAFGTPTTVQCTKCGGEAYSYSCKRCHGTGNIEVQTSCKACRGSGHTGFWLWQEDCAACDGVGHITRTHICATCNGSGVSLIHCPKCAKEAAYKGVIYVPRPGKHQGTPT